jgi:hypothetical protein
MVDDYEADFCGAMAVFLKITRRKTAEIDTLNSEPKLGWAVFGLTVLVRVISI